MFWSKCTALPNYKSAFIAYCLLFFGLTSPYIILGEVAAPHRQYVEVGRLDTNLKLGHVENRKFNDYANAYIPEISTHLKGARSGWLTLWTNQNELGRPVYQISGFSPAYLPSWIISQFADNPWRFITILSLFACFFAGVFVILFCRESGLDPLASLIAGSSFAASPLFMYWLTFPMFPAVWCWAAGVLWSVTRLARKPDLIGWSILAFSAYSLLMTAYPQAVVFHAYILTGYGLYLAYGKQKLGSLATVRFLALSASALIAGAVLALPVYIDLAHVAAESARVAPDVSFFTAVLPKVGTFREALRFFVLGTTPELFGNPVGASYPFAYDGLSVITPLVIFFAVIGLLVSYKKTWGWWLAISILCVLALVHPLYEMCVKYLGFNLSRSNPMGSIMLPLTIIVAYGADGLVKRTKAGELSKTVSIAAASTLAVIVVGLVVGFVKDIAIDEAMVLTMLILLGLLSAQHKKTRPALLMAALAIVLATISYPLMLRQDPAKIATTSPLVETVRANLLAGSRFAVANPGLSVLPPNLNAGLGLASVHSYNSLSSRRYHTLIKALGGEMQTYGRQNGAIEPDYNGSMFWMSNISLMLSPAKLAHENLQYLGQEAGVHMYKVISRMGDSLQVLLPASNLGIDGVYIADPRLLQGKSPVKRFDKGDLLEFAVVPEAPSILILSQKFHRDWQAQAYVQSRWVPVKTTVINGVFQGVLLPQFAERVLLEFRPFVRYAWIAHVFWLFLIALLGFRVWQKNLLRAREEDRQDERNTYPI